MSIETSKQNISSKVQGISDKLNVGAMPLLSKPSVSFGRSYFAQTEVLNLPTAGEDVISGYKDLNLKAALDENDQLKKLIQSLKEDFSTLIPILLGVGGVLAVLPSAKAEELMDQLSSGDLSNLTEDDLNNMVAMAEPAPTTDAYFDGTTPTEDAFRESQQLTVMKGTPLISELISLGESSGNYDITFGGNKYQSPESFSGGKKLTEMTLSEVMAFQNQRNSTVRNTGAVGKYQFISSTLKALVQQSGMNPNTTKFTPEVQEQLQSLLLRQNIKDLQKKGIIVTPANLSLAHYVGTGGVAAVQKAIENGDGDLSVRDAILKYTGKDVGAQNEELIRTKAKDFEKMQSTKLERKAREKGIELSAGYFQQEINLETLEPNRSVKSTVAEEESLNPENLQQPKQTGSEISRSSEEIQEQEDKDETIVVPTATTEQPPASNPIVQNTPANAPKSSTSADVLHLDYASYFAVA